MFTLATLGWALAYIAVVLMGLGFMGAATGGGVEQTKFARRFTYGGWIVAALSAACFFL